MSVEHLGKPYTLRHLSFSTIQKYMECPRKFYLSKVGGLDTSTYFVTLMGTAVHHITEQADLKRAGFDYVRGETTPKSFAKVFRREVRAAKKNGVEIKASGKEVKTKVSWYGGPNKKDMDWCLHFGPVIIQAWADFVAENGLVLATMPDGKPGAEVPLHTPIGGVNFSGFIDRVFDMGDGTVTIVDLKTGMFPSDAAQLGLYALQLREMGLQVDLAAFWGRTEGTTKQDLVFDVPYWATVEADRDAVFTDQVRGVAQGMEAGAFYGNTNSKFGCGTCAVRDFCSVVQGAESDMIPEPVPVRVLRAGETLDGGSRRSGVGLVFDVLVGEKEVAANV